jgi:dienelactone hydrolase
MKSLFLSVGLMILPLWASADPTNTAPAAPVAAGDTSLPPLPSPRTPVPGIDFYVIQIDGDGPGRPMEIDLYLPSGQHTPKSLPCVVIAPAGTGNHGGKIEDGDRPEHIPYVQAGFAVVAYELSGTPNPPHKESYTYGEMKLPISQFIQAKGGLINAQTAIDYVLNRVPEIDPTQLYACGHSSAATMALNLARNDKRIRACCAYAPQPDVEKWLGDPKWDQFVPGYTAFLTSNSPLRHVADFNCPVYLFHADDDSMVSLADVQAFVDAMKAAGKQITFERVATGNHYQSMIDQGIPGGIKFMQSMGAKPLPPVLSPAAK